MHRSEPTRCAMYGRRPRCKGKEFDAFAKRSGAAMYPASECSRCGYCFATCLDKFWPASLSRFFIGLLLTFLIFAVVGWLH